MAAERIKQYDSIKLADIECSAPYDWNVEMQPILGWVYRQHMKTKGRCMKKDFSLQTEH